MARYSADATYIPVVITSMAALDRWSSPRFLQDTVQLNTCARGQESIYAHKLERRPSEEQREHAYISSACQRELRAEPQSVNAPKNIHDTSAGTALIVASPSAACNA